MCYYNSQRLGLLQITTTCYYNLRYPGYYNSRQLLLQCTTGITIYDDCYYNLQQVLQFTTEQIGPKQRHLHIYLTIIRRRLS